RRSGPALPAQDARDRVAQPARRAVGRAQDHGPRWARLVVLRQARPQPGARHPLAQLHAQAISRVGAHRAGSRRAGLSGQGFVAVGRWLCRDVSRARALRVGAAAARSRRALPIRPGAALGLTGLRAMSDAVTADATPATAPVLDDAWVIFGASSGIARAFMRIAAHHHKPLVLAGRDVEDLSLDGRDLVLRGSPAVRTLPFDADAPQSFAALASMIDTALPQQFN